MSSFSKPRVKRGPPPRKVVKRGRHRKALPELMRDFGERCAYSMQHQSRAGALEVDHFDPRKKKDLIQQYDNLFPASRHCNSKKSDNWPNKVELTAGCRFLNPCKEMDYGEQILEDPETWRLVGATPAAIWHIRICGLNADHLVNERAKRAKYAQQLLVTPIRVRRGFADVGELIASLRDEVDTMIPQIPPSPTRRKLLSRS